MAFMRAVGEGHQRPAHTSVYEDSGAYRIEVDLADFTESEVSVEALGRRLTVRGDQVETADDSDKAFRLHERIEESFRLPDDADVDSIKVFFKHGRLEIQAPRILLEPRQLPIEHASYRFDPNAEPC
jgi:HSP20 family molecular chaperone IbpA